MGCCRDFTERLSENLSVVGVRHVFGSATFYRKAMWILVLLTVSAAMLFFFIDRLLYYVSRPKMLDQEYSYQTDLDFPAVTICNRNILRTTTLFNGQHEDRLDSLYPSPDLPPHHNLYILAADVYSIGKNTKLNITEREEALLSVHELGVLNKPARNYKEFMFKYGHRLQDMLLDCTWNGLPCGADDFERVSTDAGVCFVFNSNATNPKTIRVAGTQSGLSVMFNAEQYEYSQGFSEAGGFIVGIRDQNEPAQLVETSGVAVDFGSEVNIGLLRTDYDDLGPPYSTCNETHGMLWCVLDCLTTYISDNCNCFESYMKITENGSYCTPLQLATCSWPLKDTFASLNEFPEYCHCSRGCHRKDYSLTVSTSRISSFSAWSLSAWFQVSKPEMSNLTQSHFSRALLHQDWARLFVVDRWYAFAIRNLTINLQEFEQKVIELSGNSTANVCGDEEEDDTDDDNDTDDDDEEVICFEETRSLLQNILSIRQSLESSPIMDRENGLMFDILYAHDVSIKDFVFKTLLQQDIELQMKTVREKMFNLTVLTAGNNRHQVSNFTEVDELFVSWERLYETHNVLDSRLAADDILKGAGTLWHSRLTPNDVRDNFVRLRVYMKDKSILTVTQQADYSFSALLCDVGGNLGLYLGASLLTLVELVDIILGLFTNGSGQVRREKNTPENTTTL